LAWNQSIRRQLALSFSTASLLVILGSGFLLFQYERNEQYALATRRAVELAHTLSFSSTSWVLANDLAGLQEVVKGVSDSTDLKWAVILSPENEVLASTRDQDVGKYFSDAVSQRLLAAGIIGQQILLDEDNLIDVAVPVMAEKRLIGWVRMELTRNETRAYLHELALAGLGIALLLVLTLIGIAIWLSRSLTSGLNRLAVAASDAAAGRVFSRVDQARPDEIGVLARHLYRILDTIDEKQQALIESEQQFKLLTDHSPLAIYVSSGIEQRAEYINPTFTRTFGYTLEEVPSVAQWWTKAYPDEACRKQVRDEWTRKVEQAIATFPQIAPVETIVTCKDGSVKNVQWGYVSMGMQRWAFGLDLTERKRLETELIRYKDHLEEEVQERTADLLMARDEAESANRAKSVFLASMSHELRTPLNAILGFSSLMRRDEQLRPEQGTNLDIINRSGEHLLTLINDILEMSKIEAGKTQLNITPFDLGNMVRDVTDMMELRAREKGLQLLLDQSSEFPRYIMGDEVRLRQILINLLGNAVKFTSQGGVTLRLRTKQNATAHLIIEIEDTGPGISAEDKLHLFQPFMQFGKQAGDNKGTGLGLSITRQFVQMMGGSISVESTPEKGSLFLVDLPLSEVKEANLPPPQDTARGEVIGLELGQPAFRILIVEDQLENQLLLTQLMQRIGLEVKLAEDGRQAVQLFKSWQPDLIFMDRRMPVMDGIDATRAIRQLPGGKEVKIVAVTASAFMEQRDEMLVSGMDGFVRKPYRFNEIYDSLARHLGVHYRYASVQEETVVALTAEMLAVLPQALRNELKTALESLESELINEVLNKIASCDVVLHDALAPLVESYDYPAILKQLQTASE
jgi:PAS domain S-box-containing protein